ncbi:hypothetical protein DYB35_010655 [Aphanomyces astaci]|uniref:MalT-like TPR region domain-containing protein n=1 Tax=Aphanomyces astaci TaxID=112090 RepID=A0A3R6ZCX0_APHAT|nr:hypothetical protein DYB35_010655 [Aphanomyces astaci]
MQAYRAYSGRDFAQYIKLCSCALEALDKELESGSRRPYLQAEKGILLMHRASSLTLAGKVHEALQDGIAAVELDRKNLRAHICVAKCCVLLGKADDAKEAYQQMDLILRGLNRRLYPRLDDYRAQLHEGLLAVESLESLLREINRCTVANDNKGALRATEDAIAIALNSFELRMQKLKLLMTLWYGNTMYISEKAKLLVNRAAALVMVGKFQEALQDGIAAVELDRTFLRAHLRVAKCCVLLGKADDAKEAYQQMDLVLRGLNPRQYPRLDDYRAQLHEGLLAVESLESLLWEINRCTVANDNKGALRATKDAMAIAIGSQELRLQKVEEYCTYLVRKSASGGIISLGIKMSVLYCRALHYHNKTEQAFEVLEQLLRVAPTNVDLLHVKRLWELMEDVSLAAYEAFNRGDCNKAVLLYTKALTLDKHHRTYNASVLGSRATTYMALAQYDKAVQDCNAALKYRPESVADYDEYMAKAKMTPDDLRHVRRERDQVQEDWDRSKYRRDGWDNDFPYSWYMALLDGRPCGGDGISNLLSTQHDEVASEGEPH